MSKRIVPAVGIVIGVVALVAVACGQQPGVKAPFHGHRQLLPFAPFQTPCTSPLTLRPNLKAPERRYESPTLGLGQRLAGLSPSSRCRSLPGPPEAS